MTGRRRGLLDEGCRAAAVAGLRVTTLLHTWNGLLQRDRGTGLLSARRRLGTECAGVDLAASTYII